MPIAGETEEYYARLRELRSQRGTNRLVRSGFSTGVAVGLSAALLVLVVVAIVVLAL